jgi:hypothetical protein
MNVSVEMINGEPVYVIQDDGAVAVVSSHGVVRMRGASTEAFRAVVGALREWTERDQQDFGGLNAGKLRRELLLKNRRG